MCDLLVACIWLFGLPGFASNPASPAFCALDCAEQLCGAERLKFAHDFWPASMTLAGYNDQDHGIKSPDYKLTGYFWLFLGLGVIPIELGSALGAGRLGVIAGSELVNPLLAFDIGDTGYDCPGMDAGSPGMNTDTPGAVVKLDGSIVQMGILDAKLVSLC